MMYLEQYFILGQDINPWGSGARLQDYHHSHNLFGTFGGGITGLWDWAFGTDVDFRSYEMQRILNSRQ